MELVLLVSFPVVVVLGLIAWNLRSHRETTGLPHVPVRRREDARDWQRRFGAESLLNANFHPPTQNEILETLSVLDHLTPRWEIGDSVVAENAFLNELALNFPTLRKAGCVFPAVGVDNPETAATAARREAFRAHRAQVNALDQIVSSSVVPDGSVLDNALTGRAGANLWPFLLGGAAVLVAVALAGLRFHPGAINFKSSGQPGAEANAAAATLVTEAPAATPIPATASEAVAQPAPTPPVPTAPVAVAKADSTPAGANPVLQQQVAASKQRAADKYPALLIEGSEINLRFVFRYKNLVQEHSPRLLDSNWPEQLVEECAAASGASAKRDGYTRVLGTPR